MSPETLITLISPEFRPLATAVIDYLSPNEVAKLPNRLDHFVDFINTVALSNIDIFGEKLAEVIAREYHHSPYNERFIQDPKRKGPLMLDADGHIVTLINAEISRSESEPFYFYLKDYDTYEVLTGPLVGRSYSREERPLPEIPEYKPRTIARWLQQGPEPPAITVTVNLDPDVFRWFKEKGKNWEHFINAALKQYIEEH